MQSSDIGQHRLTTHRISQNQHESVANVVRWQGAMQAQDYKQSLWAIGARLQSATIDTVEQALADAQIVRTWSQRGTIHYVPAEDTLWMLDLCASRILSGHGRRMKQLNLTEKTMRDCENYLREALADGNALTRSEVFVLLNQKGEATEKQRGYHILWHLAHEGIICMGAMQGKEQTFVLLEDWVTTLRQLSREEALTELVKRYFKSHSPATEADFARWSGLTLTDTRKGIAENADWLSSIDIGDETYWFDASLEVPSDSDSVYLLAAFDEYLLGYKDRSAVLPDDHANKVVPENNGVFQPIIVVDGQVVGIWKRKLKKKSVDIICIPFTTFGDAQEAIVAESEKYATFMGLALKITFE
ncbi:MAG: winged helix DNA-binding domain-containing protein [Chloroflexota bacterium]